VVTIEQVGSDVVSTGSGAIDLSGLSFDFSNTTPCICVIPNFPFIVTGLPGDKITAYLAPSSTFSGPANFGSGGTTFASSGSGDVVGIDQNIIAVPVGYVSDDFLSSSATFDNATLLSLGITPGTYTWTWGLGSDQSFTLDIGATPLPAALPLFVTGLGALLGWRRKRKVN
jgi:hypothetical protein